MSNKIFEEAIADAKLLREVAEANAKKAVLEAVTPKIREFIESELLEGQNTEEDELEEVVHEDELTLDESALQKLSILLGLNDKNVNAEIVSEASKLAYSKLDLNQKKELNIIADKIKKTKRTLESNVISNKDVNLKENSKMKEKFYEVDLKALREAVEEELSNAMEGEDMEKEAYSLDDEDSLEDMLQELKLVLDLGDDLEKDQIPEELRAMVEDDDEDESDEDLEMSDDMGDEEMSDEMSDDMGDEEMPAGENPFSDDQSDEEEVEVDEKALAEEILRIRKLVREGKMDHHFGGKGEAKAGVDGAFGGKGSGKAGVTKAFGGGAEGKDVFTNPPTMNKLAEAIRDERRKNRALSEKLGKYRSAVNTLREQLEDLNLFNAKLLYVNKLLQNKNLNESEKKSVIKALDEAKSLREAKSLYKSLTETFARGGNKTLTESRTRGSSSRPTTSSSPKQNSGPELDRWQRLAGLKNN
jgi:hypothetical protein